MARTDRAPPAKRGLSDQIDPIWQLAAFPFDQWEMSRQDGTAPIDRPGIAYTSHPYPQKEQPEPASKENFFALWEEKWGFASKQYPMICTELGWVRPDGYGAHIPVMNDGSYGPRIIEFMESRGISWTAWVFDPHWSPTLITDWDFTPSEQGAFFKQVMQDEARKSSTAR